MEDMAGTSNVGFCPFTKHLVPPILPNLHICDEIYAKDMLMNDCKDAVRLFVDGIHLGPYSTLNEPHYNPLPRPTSAGGCHVALEVAGPTPPPPFLLNGQEITYMAQWLLGQCVLGKNGLGGFVTAGISTLVKHVARFGTDITAPYPPITHFITLTIYDSPDTLMQPGDHDPAIALALSDYTNYLARNIPGSPNFQGYDQLRDKAQVWSRQANKMARGGWKPWWEIDGDDVEQSNSDVSVG